MFRGAKLWYERLFGCEERWELVKEDLVVHEEGGLCYLTGPNGVKYCAGRFEHVSVADLNSRPSPEYPPTPTSMSIVTGDVVEFICNPDNNGAVFQVIWGEGVQCTLPLTLCSMPKADLPCNRVFKLYKTTLQVASQFNCLEFINPAIIPEHGVDRYEHDHTQGPACSIACGPGTVYRNYFVNMPITPEYSKPQVGQTEHRQLDGFDDITRDLKNVHNKYFKQQNGYLTANETQLNEFYTRLEELKVEKSWPDETAVEENLWAKLKIGVHYDVEVTSRKWGKDLTTSPGQRVTQVFASAAAVGYSRSINRKLWEPLARGILNSSYDGAFCVAKSNPTKKLFLTFIGGGVFQNSMTWIADAILRAARKHADAGIQVYLVCYGDIPKPIDLMVKEFWKS